MLTVDVPYAVVVLLALLAYAVLGWRQRYLASALILGPFTLLRLAVAVLGAAAGAVTSRDLLVGLMTCLSALAVLAVEPLADKLWYNQRPAK
jgi:hypothetical protein